MENKFKLLAGPCALESEESVMYLAEKIKKIDFFETRNEEEAEGKMLIVA